MFGTRGKLIVGGALLCGALQLFSPFRCGVVCGWSMAPTLKSGQPFLIDRNAFNKQPVSRNDIVVFEREGKSYVKRVAAVAGDQFYVLRFLDTDWDYPLRSEELPRVRRLLRHSPSLPAKLVQRHVPAGSCYVLGDAAQCSEDSRFFGPVPLETLRGKLLMAPTLPPLTARVASSRGPVRL